MQVPEAMHAYSIRPQRQFRRSRRGDGALGEFARDHREYLAPRPVITRRAAVAGRCGNKPQLGPWCGVQSQVNRLPRVEPDQMPPTCGIGGRRPHQARETASGRRAVTALAYPERRCECGHAGKLSQFRGGRYVGIHCQSFVYRRAPGPRTVVSRKAVSDNTKDRRSVQRMGAT